MFDAIHSSEQASHVAQMVKNLLTVVETRVRSLGWEDPLEEGMATHQSILAWRIPWTEGPSRLQSMGSQRVGHDSATNTRTHTHIHQSSPRFLDSSVSKESACNAGDPGSVPGSRRSAGEGIGYPL